jgi:hypothetical protein
MILGHGAMLAAIAMHALLLSITAVQVENSFDAILCASAPRSAAAAALILLTTPEGETAARSLALAR